MIAVIFEVWPTTEDKEGYLEEAARMRELLDTIDGFISIERFSSLVDNDKLLSLSFFRDEEAVNEWRNTLAHRKAQALGRSKYFVDYRLRVAEVVRDYSKNDRDQAPKDSLEIHG